MATQQTPATAPVAVAAPTPAKGPADARAASRDSIIARARAMTNGAPLPKAESPKAAPSKTPAPAQAAAEEGEEGEEPADGSAEGDEPTEGEEEAEEGAAQTSSPDAVKALELLNAGDIEGMVKALGGDPKLADVSDRKFRALREQTAKADRKEKARQVAHQNAIKELTGISQGAQNQLREFHRENAFVQGTRKAVGEKNWGVVAKNLQDFTGMTMADLTQKLAAGKIGLSTEDKQVTADRAKLEQERRDWDAKKKAETDGQTVAQQRAKALQTFPEKLVGHPLLAVKKGFEARGKARAERAFKVWEDSWDGSKFAKTPKQAADEVHGEILEEAKANGLAQPAPKKAKLVKGDEPPKVAAPVGKGGYIDRDATRENRVAMARRMASQFSRG